MSLFGKNEKETKEEKQARKNQELIEKYGLENVNEKDLESIRRIINDLMGSELIKTGTALSFGKPEEVAKLSYLSALVEQNWIIIRQLEQLNNKFK